MMTPVRYDFTGRTAVVTGGARGIGRAIGERLARDGARVVVWDLDPKHFDSTVNDYRPADIVATDVAEPSSVEDAFARTLDVVGHLDILVNNAGINGPIVSAWELDPKIWQRILDVNLNGVYHASRAVVPHLLERGQGRIVNIASMAGKDGNAQQSAYSVSKAGVIAFTKSLGKELATGGVTVNAIAPAMAQTELFAQMTPEHIAAGKAKIPMQRYVSVAEIADLAAWIASDECSFTTGFTFDASGGRATY
ncbi:SDR family NAD(P)-dependent oxidoreductase [Saccharopolyspora hattusasensis]|uniref:SDR family NAD(P)-dependent oxidoreductase n=1 Tax=Saccharopolyspora hattusasensis TaxID=1128679 RepID=UPI003D97B63C